LACGTFVPFHSISFKFSNLLLRFPLDFFFQSHRLWFLRLSLTKRAGYVFWSSGSSPCIRLYVNYDYRICPSLSDSDWMVKFKDSSRIERVGRGVWIIPEYTGSHDVEQFRVNGLHFTWIQ
jgi:hypothetical protein